MAGAAQYVWGIGLWGIQCEADELVALACIIIGDAYADVCGGGPGRNGYGAGVDDAVIGAGRGIAADTVGHTDHAGGGGPCIDLYVCRATIFLNRAGGLCKFDRQLITAVDGEGKHGGIADGVAIARLQTQDELFLGLCGRIIDQGNDELASICAACYGQGTALQQGAAATGL